MTIETADIPEVGQPSFGLLLAGKAEITVCQDRTAVRQGLGAIAKPTLRSQ
jgi:hypothetical protein